MFCGSVQCLLVVSFILCCVRNIQLLLTGAFMNAHIAHIVVPKQAVLSACCAAACSSSEGCFARPLVSSRRPAPSLRDG